MININSKDDLSHLNHVYKEIADEFGIDIARKFHQNFKGLQINFPVRFLRKEYVIQQIYLEYDGSNLKKLASQYGYSERWIRAIIHKSFEEKNTREGE